MPDTEALRTFRAKIKAFQLDEFVKKLHRDSVEMSDAEFLKLKQTQVEPFQFDQLFKQPEPSEKKEVKTIYSPAPKFGMPTELFKDCIKRDDRVPKLTDKRILEAKLEEERRRREANKKVI